MCVEKLCIEWESELQTYSKGIGIRRAKNKRKIKEYRKSNIKVDSSGDMKR